MDADDLEARGPIGEILSVLLLDTVFHDSELRLIEAAFVRARDAA